MIHGFKYIISALVLLELVGLTFAVALARAAARRPIYGPPNPPVNQEH